MSEEPIPSTPRISKKEEPLIAFLHTVILYCIRLLSILMVIVILASIIDVGYVMYDKIIVTKPIGVLHIEGILTVLGAFIAVLIAVEVFNNITIYLKEDRIHGKLVLSTALIAVSRKVIILDYGNVDASYLYAMAAVVLATALAYWVVAHKT